MKRVAVDIGGTFTDCFMVWNTHYIQSKALTTHHNLALGFREALQAGCAKLNLDMQDVLAQVDSVRYATTLGTNALIQRKGPKVALLVTAGFESTVPLSRGRGYGEGLDMRAQQDLPGACRPNSLVPIPMIAGVRERLDAVGNVLMALDEEHLREQIRNLVDRGARSFVVSLVNSVSNPVHERRIQEVLLEEYPEHLLGAMPVVMSHKVAGRKGEYVRTSSAIVDAFLHDVMYHGLSSLELNLRESSYKKPMLVIHNSGGMAQLNSTDALQTIHSGPVAGVSASEHLAKEADLGNIICTDMGGTSFDIGLVVEGGVKHYDFNPVIERWMVSVPMIHLVTLGAGGGSICRYDRMYKTVQVGPLSAGSDPGPACYDRGGLKPTVTDADLVLGYLSADNYAGGQIKLKANRAKQAIEDAICDELDNSAVEAALMIKRKVDANMANGIATELRARGYDPRSFTLLAYGGNGPLHGCGIADQLGIDKILVPPFCSVFSAVGAGNMHQLHIHEKSLFMWIFDSNTKSLYKDYAKFNKLVEELENAGRQDLLRQGMKLEDIQHKLELDMRFGNQLAETTVVIPKMRLERIEDVMTIINRFSTDYGNRFGKGSEAPEAGIRINTIRVQSYVELETVKFANVKPTGAKKAAPAPNGIRKCWFVGFDQALDTALFDHESLDVGTVVQGPAVIVSPTTTYLVEPTWSVEIGEYGAAWFTRAEGSSAARRRAAAAHFRPEAQRPQRILESSDMGKNETLSYTDQEKAIVDQFLADNVLFLGPDPEIMNEHDIAPRTPFEEEALAKVYDPAILALVRDRLQAGANESFEMLEQMGAAPGAKWGDLITGVFTAAGDLGVCSAGGVLIFASLVHHPVKFINKFWAKDPTVGLKEGDGFIHNDARYGNIHNTDQSMILPVYWKGRLIAWAGSTVHEGENGAIEPGGMPSLAESVYEEGLKMSPFKIAENYELKKDLVTFLQNSVREPKLQFEDMKTKLFACRRMEKRIHSTIEEFGVHAVVASLRLGLEDCKAEVSRRVSEWPDGVVRTMCIADSTLRENAMIKICLEMRKVGDELVCDFRGSSPEFANRCNNTLLASLKGMLAQLFLVFVWPDLPRNQAVFAPIKVITDPNSALSSSYTTPNAQSMMTFFPAFTATQQAVAKYMYSCPEKFSKLVAPWHNMIRTFIWGGITQHNEMVGNLCADLNGMGGGARSDRDGEHAIAPIFAPMADLGEQELNEEEVPFIQIVSKKLMKDNQAFGKYRGGQGYEMIASSLGSPLWGFMTCCIGSKMSSVPGLFGGYGAPTYPLCKVKNVDVFEVMKTDPKKFKFSIVDIMNERPFEGASYTTHHTGLQFEIAKRGELYMITQGAGGGYGDVLERDPEFVIKDLEENLISDETARRIYFLVYNPETLVLDREGTERARQAERDARKKRGVPFKQFVKTWTKPTPPPGLPYYGSWDDRNIIYAGSADIKTTADTIQPIYMPNPKDVKIAALEKRIAELEAGKK